MFGSAYAQRNLPACLGTNTLQWNFCNGTATWPNGQSYIGEWKNGQADGQGTLIYGDGPFKGGKYIGQFSNNIQSGRGTYTVANGDKYVGEWKDGKINGQGTYTFADGEKYVGAYKDGKRDGKGTNNYRNGDIYVGEWKDGKANGQGIVTYADGKKYVGGFKDDNFHMQGTEYASNGSITRQGIWTNGFLTTSAPVPQVTASSAQPINSERDRLTAEFAAEIKKREELERQLSESNKRKKILSELDSLLRR